MLTQARDSLEALGIKFLPKNETWLKAICFDYAALLYTSRAMKHRAQAVRSSQHTFGGLIRGVGGAGGFGEAAEASVSTGGVEPKRSRAKMVSVRLFMAATNSSASTTNTDGMKNTATPGSESSPIVEYSNGSGDSLSVNAGVAKGVLSRSCIGSCIKKIPDTSTIEEPVLQLSSCLLSRRLTVMFPNEIATVSFPSRTDGCSHLPELVRSSSPRIVLSILHKLGSHRFNGNSSVPGKPGSEHKPCSTALYSQIQFPLQPYTL